jgi:CMP/dCMP kinase
MPRPDGPEKGPGAAPVVAPIVAIDGPSGAGKSTVARAVARRLGFLYLDTGALYRAVGLKAREAGVDPHDAAAMARLCAGLDLAVRAGPDGATRVLLDGRDRTLDLRSEAVSALASAVSAQPSVRARLLGLQRDAGARGGIVMDGRDVGTVVFPDARVKVFLDADPEERARRRHAELAAKGQAEDAGATLRAVAERDAADRGRALAPLVQASDAVRIDTTRMALEAVVTQVCDLVRAASGRA